MLSQYSPFSEWIPNLCLCDNSMNIHILVHGTSSKFKTNTVPFHAITLCLGQGNHVDPEAQTYMQWHLLLIQLPCTAVVLQDACGHVLKLVVLSWRHMLSKSI